MRVAVCFTYILCQILYLLPFMPSTKPVYAFGIATHIAMVGFMAHLLCGVKGFSENERLLFSYIKYLSIANVMYVFFCAYKGSSFAFYNTPLFAYILGIGFITFLAHCALNNKS